MEIFGTAAGTQVVLRGRFDAEAVMQASARWEQLAETCESDVAIDLSEVTFIDAAAIGTITYLFKRLAARRLGLQLQGVGGQPRKLLELLRVDRVIDMAPAPAGHVAAGPARPPGPRRGVAWLLMSLVGLGGCMQSWPPPGQGGLAERRPPLQAAGQGEGTQASLALLTRRLGELRREGAQARFPGQVMNAERTVARIQRGLAGGLPEDAELDLARLRDQLDALSGLLRRGVERPGQPA